MNCRFCGAANPANFVVCQRCGERRVIDLSQAPAPQVVPTTRAPVQQQPAPWPPRPPTGSGSFPPPGPQVAPGAHVTSGPGGLQAAILGHHAEYRGARIRHEPPDELISSEVTVKTLRPHLLRFAIFYLLEFILGIFWLPFALMNAISGIGSAGFGGQSSGGGALGALTWFLMLLMAGVGVAWLVSLFLPIREPIAEYGILLENGAGASADAYGWIAHSLQHRQMSIHAGDASTAGRHLLTLASGLERAAVLVTGYGADLYLGWTMWRSRSTVQVLIHYFRDLVETLRGGTYAGDVRVADTRAFRELVHSVTREGVQVVVVHLTPAP